MATIKIDRGFTHKTQVVQSYKPTQAVPQVIKRKKPTGGPSGLAVALIAVGALVLVAVVVFVGVVFVGRKPAAPKAASTVLEPAVAQPVTAPAAAPQAPGAQKPQTAAQSPAAAPAVQAKVRVCFNEKGSSFAFEAVPRPAENDAGASARFSLVDCEIDHRSGLPFVLNDGRIPTGKDQSKNNLFFRKGSDGGRLLADLGRTVSIKEVNTYSWHSEMRGPQVYVLYGGDEESKDFVVDPGRNVDPATVGWRRLATVDTRPQSGTGSGQHGVSIAAEKGTLGSYRFLLFVVKAAEMSDDRGNTFFSEIDVLDADSTAGLAPAKAADSEILYSDREVRPGSPQGLLCEYFDTISGNVADDLRRSPKYPDKPDWTIQAKRFELPEKLGEQYGARVRGYLVPPESGSYTFVLNVDDGGEFWLSSDESPANLRKLINLSTHTSKKWTSYPEQQSEPCQLVAGQRYYLEAFVKQGMGQDYLAVGWFGPVTNQVAVIDGKYLQPWKGEAK